VCWEGRAGILRDEGMQPYLLFSLRPWRHILMAAPIETYTKPASWKKRKPPPVILWQVCFQRSSAAWETFTTTNHSGPEQGNAFRAFTRAVFLLLGQARRATGSTCPFFWMTYNGLTGAALTCFLHVTHRAAFLHPWAYRGGLPGTGERQWRIPGLCP